MHFRKPDILLTWGNTTFFTLFDITFSFIIVVIDPEFYFHFVFRSRKSTKQPIGNTLIVLSGNNWMYGTNQPLSLKQVNYRMSYLNFSWQILRWKEYASSQLITPVWKVNIYLPWHLSAMRVAATGMVRASRMENAPLQDTVKLNKEKCGSSDVVTDVSSNITAVR